MEHPWKRLLREMRFFIVEHMTTDIMDNTLNNARPLLDKDDLEDIEIIVGLRRKTRCLLDKIYRQSPCDILTIITRGEPNLVSDTFLLLISEVDEQRGYPSGDYG